MQVHTESTSVLDEVMESSANQYGPIFNGSL